MAKRRESQDCRSGSRLVKVLVDENLDETFPEFMPGHDVTHIAGAGWQGIKNGVLLEMAANAGFQVLVSADKNMPYQQSMNGRSLFLIVLDIHPNILVNQVACVEMIEKQIKTAKPGNVYVVEGPHPKRRTP